MAKTPPPAFHYFVVGMFKLKQGHPISPGFSCFKQTWHSAEKALAGWLDFQLWVPIYPPWLSLMPSDQEQILDGASRALWRHNGKVGRVLLLFNLSSIAFPEMNQLKWMIHSSSEVFDFCPGGLWDLLAGKQASRPPASSGNARAAGSGGKGPLAKSTGATVMRPGFYIVH